MVNASHNDLRQSCAVWHMRAAIVATLRAYAIAEHCNSAASELRTGLELFMSIQSLPCRRACNATNGPQRTMDVWNFSK